MYIPLILPLFTCFRSVSLVYLVFILGDVARCIIFIYRVVNLVWMLIRLIKHFLSDVVVELFGNCEFIENSVSTIIILTHDILAAWSLNRDCGDLFQLR